MKTFLRYTKIDLLGQQVNSISLFTAEAKLKALAKLKFLSTVLQLETFLRITKYLQKFIPKYAAVAKLLQELKTSLFKTAPIKDYK